ncbi:DUF4242 domain-containing protein [Sphingomonas sp. HITSZ_GF]|uniref:DUF4242 domain-containing protein n=1 Tax=Sphingomonas sp. HITSZ_GF TaxID=3037247 RepID=UPI00240D44E7|nr:DUF4242 domain-containing protein [Sphingomonas sp. HITSZ_GF]MDG2533911.1 DUF4242 domain-containing protein [Sphingomonas sp. HITSZ_GF]
MKHYLIERRIPGIGTYSQEQLRDAAVVSNDALDKLAGRARWLQSFVVADGTFCSYLAESEDAIREHAGLSGFPVTNIYEVQAVIGPETASG